MTVDEAKAKWCPMVRASTYAAITEDGAESAANCCNNGERNPDWSRCIGPECMMWVADRVEQIGKEWGHCGLVHPIDGKSVQ